MLLTLLMNNLMEGTPPTPSTQTGESNLIEAVLPLSGGLRQDARDQEVRGKIELREKDEEDIIYHMITFVICQE